MVFQEILSIRGGAGNLSGATKESVSPAPPRGPFSEKKPELASSSSIASAYTMPLTWKLKFYMITCVLPQLHYCKYLISILHDFNTNEGKWTRLSVRYFIFITDNKLLIIIIQKKRFFKIDQLNY